uniref:ribonuclease H n=1 Tax=Wuchereria bancrofti TaxID=6293 RepID=A0A1I8EXR9_WUCBA
DEHRFNHGCQFKNLDVEQLAATSCDGSKPLKSFLCSMNGCFTCEIIRIDCQRCGLNFCLKHRYPEEHQCDTQTVKNEQINDGYQEELKKKMSMIIAADRMDIAGANIISSLPQKEKLIPPAEQMFLFVVENQKREPVMVSKRWTIGRCLDQITRQLSISNNNASFGTKILRLYCETDQLNPLPMDGNVEKYLEDFSNVFFKRDEMAPLIKLSRCFYSYNAISSVAISARRFSSAPDFDALAQKIQQWKEKSTFDNSDNDDEISSADKIIEKRAWMSAPLVYCDGSFDWTLRKGGIGIFWSPNDERNAHLSLTGSKLTNIRAEIQAVSLAALQACSLDFDRVIIKTDSQFVVKVINSWLSRWRSNEWKKADGKQIENMDDIQKLSRYTDMIKMRVEHTYGHQKYDERKELEESWDAMSCDERDRCGNFHSDRLSRLAVDQPMMTDEQFEELCKAKLDKHCS